MILKDKLIRWATAGDGDCAYKLAVIFHNEGNRQKYIEWLEKSVATKNFDAMKEYADCLRENAEYDKALALYKELAETFCDEESMEAIVNMVECGQGDKEILNFILELIGKNFNDIYQRENFARVFAFQTLRHDECTWEYLQAVERRRIAARIRKLLSQN